LSYIHPILLDGFIQAYYCRRLVPWSALQWRRPGQHRHPQRIPV